jgi:hypothetical protein
VEVTEVKEGLEELIDGCLGGVLITLVGIAGGLAGGLTTGLTNAGGLTDAGGLAGLVVGNLARVVKRVFDGKMDCELLITGRDGCVRWVVRGGGLVGCGCLISCILLIPLNVGGGVGLRVGGKVGLGVGA